MATRPYVPRADGESSIGVAGKKWGKIYAYDIDEKTNLGNNKSLGYRQPSNAQTVGDVRYHATLPTGWYLECTTAGTTGSGALTITSPTVGGTVSDGTVTWTVRKNASTQDLTGYLPLSGGSIANGALDVNSSRIIITKNVHTTADAHFVIKGGEFGGSGSSLELFGPKNSNSEDAGSFKLATNNGNSFRGYTTGELFWNGNSLDKSAVVAESLGSNGYRKYASGLIEQWGHFRNVDSGYMSAGVYTIYFPISFPTVGRVITSSSDEYNAAVTNYFNDRINVSIKGPVYEIFWFAIGY